MFQYSILNSTFLDTNPKYKRRKLNLKNEYIKTHSESAKK